MENIRESEGGLRGDIRETSGKHEESIRGPLGGHGINIWKT